MSNSVLVLIFLLAVPSTFAAEDKDAPDFSEGLEQLAELGLPAMEGAIWEKSPNPQQRDDYLQGWEFRELKAKIRGETWKLAVEKDMFLGFATGTSRLIESAASEGASASETVLQKMARNFKAQNPSDAPKKSRPPLIKTDVEALIKALEKPEAREEVRSRLSYRGAEVPGRCLIFAAQVHASGEHVLGNRLAAAVFELVPDRTLVIDAAVSHFADSELKQINEDFFSHHDWKSYHQNLKALADKYPRGWGNRLALALLLPGIEERLNLSSIPEPTLPGITLDREALAILDEWIEKPSDNLTAMADANGIDLREMPAQYRSQLLASLQGRHFGINFNDREIWLLPKTEQSKELPDAGTPGPITRIKELRMDGLIAIAAAATDETFTHIRNPNSGSSSYSSNDSPVEKAAQAYAAMGRPLTRGEIAVSLLAAVIPGFESGDRNDEDPQMIQESAIEFWKQNRGKNHIELAEIYLIEGSGSQQASAAGFLSSSTDPAAAAAFEKAVLESDDILRFTSLIPGYLQQKKSAGLSFFTKYSRQLTETLEGVDEDELSYSSGAWEIKQAGGVEPYLKKIGVAVGASSVSDLIAEALKSEPSQAQYPQLLEGIRQIPARELLPHFGKALATADLPTKAPLLQTLASAIHPGYRDDEESPDLVDTFPEELAKLWLPIVEDETTLPSATGRTSWFNYYDCRTVGSAAALTLEFACQKDSAGLISTYTSVHFDNDSFPGFITRRMLARINGGKLEEYPSADNVPDDRLKEIANLANSSKGPDLRAKVIGLNPDERAAWLGWWDDLLDEGTTIPESILDLRTLVTGRVEPSADSHPNPDGTLLESLKIEAGYRLDPTSLKKISTYLLENSDENSGTVISFENAPLWLGLDVVAFKPKGDTSLRLGKPHSKLNNFFEADKTPEAQALAILISPSQRNFYQCWGVQDGKISEVEISSSVQESLSEQMTKFLETKVPSPLALTISVLTRKDFEQQQNQE